MIVAMPADPNLRPLALALYRPGSGYYSFAARAWGPFDPRGSTLPFGVDPGASPLPTLVAEIPDRLLERMTVVQLVTLAADGHADLIDTETVG